MTSWVIKASKRCNIRCLYCYEWPHLDDASRISPDNWQKLLVNIKKYHLYLLRDRNINYSNLVWHGGEPLLLPPRYFSEIFSIQKEVLSEIGSFVTNSIQTNLFSIKKEHIEILKRHNVGVGVSYDHYGGVRITKNGKFTEESVLNNVNILRSNGIQCGFITVIAAHTWQRMEHIYNFYAQNGATFRALALRDGGSDNKDIFSIDFQKSADALFALFVAKFNHDIKVPVDPIDGYLQTVLRKIIRIPTKQYDRRADGESVFIVDTDGGLFSTNASYQNCLGNVFEEDIIDIISGSRYDESLRLEEEIIDKSCHNCIFSGPCDHFPAVQEYSTAAVDRCLAQAVMTKIETFLRSESIDGDLLLSLAKDGLNYGTPRSYQANMV